MRANALTDRLPFTVRHALTGTGRTRGEQADFEATHGASLFMNMGNGDPGWFGEAGRPQGWTNHGWCSVCDQWLVALHEEWERDPEAAVARWKAGAPKPEWLP